MSSIGSRLRGERERLGYNQSELAEIGGTTRKSQFLYESDARRPDADYLAAIATAGANLLYIVIGSSEHPPPARLSTVERKLVEHFREAPPAVRKAAMAALQSATSAPVTDGELQVPSAEAALAKGKTRGKRD